MVKENADYKRIFVRLTKILGDNRVKKSSFPLQIIVKPKTTDDVSRILKLAESEEIPVYPVREMAWVKVEANDPAAIMMNTADMNGIFDVDEENLAVTVGPGVLWKDLYSALSKRKYSIGSYPDSSTLTVGDWIDFNGSGIGSYRHGFAVDQIRTMEIVLPDGKIIDTGFKNVLPNSSGYNLNGLFVGADSTLGIITKVTLKMFPKPEVILPSYYTFSQPDDMNRALSEMTKHKVTPLNISFYENNHLQTLNMFGKNVPDLQGMIVNVTLAGLKDVVVHDNNVVNQVMENHGGQKVPDSSTKALWNQRFFEIQSKGGGLKPFFAEVLVPLSRLSELINEARVLMDKVKTKGAIMGIVSDRSTVSLTPYILLDKKSSQTSRIPGIFSEKLGEISLRYNGRPVGSTMYLVSGIKKVYGEGINTILDIKSAIDPHDIMNPLVLK
jgi:FAD/FMN-containing dehydrogenase